MKSFTVVLTLASFAISPVFASQQCTPGKWRELKNEKKFLKANPKIVQREGGTLTIHFASGQVMTLKDQQEAPGGPYSSHRVIGVSPGKWVALFEPSSYSMSYRIVHLGSGNVETLDGCPEWSPKGDYFVALNEDWESGQTGNDASLWYCEMPSIGCATIWRLPKAGGKEAHWTDGEVKIVVTETADAKPRTVECKPKKKTANCR